MCSVTVIAFVIGYKFVKRFYKLCKPNQTIFSKTIYFLFYILNYILSFCLLSFATASSVVLWPTIQLRCHSQKSFVEIFKLKTRFRRQTGREWLAILNCTLEISENNSRMKNKRLDFVLFNYRNDFSQIIIFDRFAQCARRLYNAHIFYVYTAIFY